MLNVVEKNSLKQLEPVSCRDYLSLKRAFGKFRKAKAKTRGLKVASKFAAKHRWLACDCQGETARPPILYPHAKNGIQREPFARNFPHAEHCEFAKYPEQQSRVVETYRKAVPTRRPRRLVPPFIRNQANDVPSSKNVSSARKRPGLARLLVEILETCEIQVLDEFARKEDTQRRADQIALIEESAQHIYLDTEQPLSKWIATSFSEYMDLRKRLDAEEHDWRHGRPHGIYIDTFSRIVGETLFINEERDTPYIAVDGHLYTYGGYQPARTPYLAICLVAKPMAQDAPRVIRAYAHPCLGKTHFALVDSALEKATLDQVIDCKTYLETFGLEVKILKPLSDMGPRLPTERPVCIPDFVVSAQGPLVLNSTVVVETMGYDTKAYRNRKREMKKWFRMIGGTGKYGTPIVEHDRSGETDETEIASIDSKFWTKLRNNLSTARGPRRKSLNPEAEAACQWASDYGHQSEL